LSRAILAFSLREKVRWLFHPSAGRWTNDTKLSRISAELSFFAAGEARVLKGNYLLRSVQVSIPQGDDYEPDFGRPYGTVELCLSVTQDWAALVRSYSRVLPPGEDALAVSSIRGPATPVDD